MAQPVQYHPFLVQIRPQVLDVGLRQHECVVWYTGSVSAGYSLSQLTAIGTAFGNIWATTWAHYGEPGASYQSAIVTDWTSNTGLSTTVLQPATGLGTGQLAANTAILISEKQGTRYKGGHGRQYLPSMSAQVTTDGTNVVQAVVSYFNTQFASLITAMAQVTTANGGPCQAVVYRQRTQVVPHTTPPTYQPAFTSNILQYACSSMLATQRRRLRKAPHH
jgi:hypothetical protein